MMGGEVVMLAVCFGGRDLVGALLAYAESTSLLDVIIACESSQTLIGELYLLSKYAGEGFF